MECICNPAVRRAIVASKTLLKLISWPKYITRIMYVQVGWFNCWSICMTQQLLRQKLRFLPLITYLNSCNPFWNESFLLTGILKCLLHIHVEVLFTFSDRKTRKRKSMNTKCFFWYIWSFIFKILTNRNILMDADGEHICHVIYCFDFWTVFISYSKLAAQHFSADVARCMTGTHSPQL